MISLKGFTSLNRDELRFISTYEAKIGYFREATKYYKQYTKPQDIEQAKTIIRNTHLWIAAALDLYEDLAEFKIEVENKMNELKIERWPQYVYLDNHYKTNF